MIPHEISETESKSSSFRSLRRYFKYIFFWSDESTWLPHMSKLGDFLKNKKNISLTKRQPHPQVVFRLVHFLYVSKQIVPPLWTLLWPLASLCTSAPSPLSLTFSSGEGGGFTQTTRHEKNETRQGFIRRQLVFTKYYGGISMFRTTKGNGN